jgi:quercetin dioxygenase-like cupin family protein
VPGSSSPVRLFERDARDGQIPDRFEAEGLRPHQWANGPGDSYGWHRHDYGKVLYCTRGSITFHTRSGDVELHAGDRLEIDAGVEHAATVGADGVECLEASR